MPFYSVVVPVYNRAELVRATLDSVLAQFCRDWELIVVDDGSTDDTPRVLAEYQARLGERMRVLTQNHAGPGAARNRGIAAARGRYLAFLDSDDLWFPWTLEFYRQTLEYHGFPAFLTGEPLVFQTSEQWQRAQPTARETPRIEAFADYLCAEMPTDWLSVSSFVVRRDALENKAFCARAINGEDIDFTLQMGVEPNFVNIQTPATFGYRQHAGGITARHARTMQGMEFLIESEHKGRYPGGQTRRRERLNLLSRHLRPALLEAIDRGYRRRAWRAYARSLGWHLELRRARFLLGFALKTLRPLRRRS